MRMKSVKPVGIAIILLLMLTMCTKEDPIRNYNIENETRQWTAFKEGSYWVYELSGTTTLDSTYVSKYKEYNKKETDANGTIREQQLEITITSQHGYYITKVEKNLPRGNCLKISMFDKQNSPISSVKTILVFPLDFIDQPENPDFSIIAPNEKVEIGKEVINDVIHVKCAVKGLSGFLKDKIYENHYWIARNRWIIKMQVKNAETGATEIWNLKRYKIKQ
jgi:hypothetical protein